jgi:hypothetical protein
MKTREDGCIDEVCRDTLGGANQRAQHEERILALRRPVGASLVVMLEEQIEDNERNNERPKARVHRVNSLER